MRFPSSIAALLLALACASAPQTPPPPRVAVQISGQVIDRQLREVVVTVKNTGEAAVRGVAVAVTLPAALAVVHESHAPALALRDDKLAGDRRVLTYVVNDLAPGASAAAYLPFHRSGLAALAGQEVVATARDGGATVAEARHTFPR